MTGIKKPIRCVVYTRKSSEEGLEQEFNSLGAQREAGEAHINSQKHEGWVFLPNHYDDGGISGGTESSRVYRRHFIRVKQHCLARFVDNTAFQIQQVRHHQWVAIIDDG